MNTEKLRMKSQGQVVIISSDAAQRQMFADVLKRWAVDTTFVASPVELSSWLQRHTPSLVVCEDRTPLGNYKEILRVLAAANCHTRVVVLAHDQETLAQALQEGAFDAIPIPVHRADAQWAVIHALQE